MPFMPPHSLTGLPLAEAARRLDVEGYNELPSQGRRQSAETLLSVLREPMFLLLLACAALYLLSGEGQEAVMLSGFVLVIIGITFYQERKTERALESLRDLSSPRAHVIRGGEKMRIAGRDVVCGDVVLLAEGDRVPADAVLCHALNFSVDESLLTGESVPVRKSASDDADLALGAWRMSKRRVLTRHVPAVETLGSATVLCVDKTGTLTLNRMTVTDLVVGDDTFRINADHAALPEAFHEVVEFSILASPTDPFDPMEKAMKKLGERTLSDTEHLHRTWTLQREYPLTRELLAMSRVWACAEGQDMVVAAKGAPKAIADLCHFDRERSEWLERRVEALSQEGKRVIGVARALFTRQEATSLQHEFPFEFVGLLGLEDPVRPNVREAIAECYTAGVRTLMITGDYPGTAMSIARQIGLQNPDHYINGTELESLSDAELAQRIRTVNVFARMVPEQKLQIIKALKSNGEVVAMTGDGVNDAPALKAAHIGVAMGARGTDVARGAAALVLLDDDFNSIVAAVRMGRRIYDNLKKAMMFILSVHIPIAGLSLIPVLLKWPLILFPVHIVFLELIIDPACTLIFEADPDDPNVMKCQPRSLEAKLFDRRTVARCLAQGGLALAVTLAVYALARGGYSAEGARSMAFLTLVICDLGMILTNRSLSRSILRTMKEKNPALWWVVGGTTMVITMVLCLPFLQRLSRFGPVTVDDLALALTSGVISVLLMELLKILPRRLAFE